MDQRSQFSARFDPIDAISRPTQAPVTRVRDVVICASTETDVPMEEVYAHPPVASGIARPPTAARREPVELGRSLSLDRLSDDDASLVMNACAPRGHYFVPIRRSGQRYAFVRAIDLDDWRDRRFHWDADGVLTDALMLSRLVRDNGFSTEFAA
jgi:hypothetical protein